ncbi:uncharacterized protein UTRI_10404_B [Ustilago trichophora]|uniref:Effector family protein Eff1 n=1 Tax=Ustilago trichophora TaxID=86804 RepID=A0A5C3EBJ2_9BASI|nr:uncharacterized protein UTRI_10404_B [Ustilago trichophora]
MKVLALASWGWPIFVLMASCARAAGNGEGASSSISLPSENELADAMSANLHISPIQQHRPYDGTWPWDLTRPPWTLFREPTVNTRSQYILDSFTLDDGRKFGPLWIGSNKFGPQAYPHDIPFLRDSYQGMDMRPANFERYRQFFRQTDKAVLFRPDPDMMHRIQSLITTPLRRFGWEPQAPGNVLIKQGEFLWPPVKAETDGISLNMPYNRRQHLWRAITWRFKAHNPVYPTIFHLTVPDTGMSQRHIMATTVNSYHFTEMRPVSINSDFWVFFEAVTHPQPPKKALMALIGGMFLPKDALPYLLHDGTLRPAFMQHFHPVV